MTAYLVDTHTLIWATSDPDKLSDRVRAYMEDPANRILVSHGSLWECSIKVTIGKLHLPRTFFDDLPSLGYEMLPLRENHFATYRKLPLIHRDPFDRILVAQALSENITLLSCDPEIQKYKVQVLW